MITFQKITVVLLSLIFTSMSFAAENSSLQNLNQYSEVLYGEISNDILNDVFSDEIKDAKSDRVDLLILISNDEPNSLSDNRVSFDGKMFLKGKEIIGFDASFFMTMNEGVHTDTAIHMSKGNTIVGGDFYKNESGADNFSEIDISNNNSVYHIDTESTDNKNCINKFN